MEVKKLCTISDINRALGMIEGATSTLDAAVATTIIDAVQMIDEAVKELMGDGKR